MMFRLPALPYSIDALAPHISAETLTLHHGKHHKNYVEKLNGLIAQPDSDSPDLEQIITEAHGDASKQAMFNNAAQCWNHEFLWQSMTPGGGGTPTGDVGNMINAQFGSFDEFRRAFFSAAVEHFGSGWAWLIVAEGRLKIMTTHDADLPLAHGLTALLTCDLWEHAYYVDYENRRADYVNAFLSHLANWDFANANLAAAGQMVDYTAGSD